MSDLPFTPVIILGAGRSGTNALRDALCALDGFATWPCDEINPIWRHGNLGWPNDALTPAQATEKVRASIRRAFRRIWRETGKPAFVVEKTCANTLRVPFVDAVIPQARYIQIVRDGRDVTASAQKRWRGEMEIPTLPYYIAKAKYAPIDDLPAYLWLFMKNRLSMMKTREKRMKSWGPRFEDMDEMCATDAPLDEICATQWVSCVTATDDALARMPGDKWIKVHYETLATDPKGAVRDILDFLGENATDAAISAATVPISAHGASKARKTPPAISDRLRAILAPTMIRHGYEAP